MVASDVSIQDSPIWRETLTYLFCASSLGAGPTNFLACSWSVCCGEVSDAVEATRKVANKKGDAKKTVKAIEGIASDLKRCQSLELFDTSLYS